jgi:hypothetical protein
MVVGKDAIFNAYDPPLAKSPWPDELFENAGIEDD